MKKIITLFLLLVLSGSTFAQYYNIEKLKMVLTIWGETYLFHPSVIRADRKVEWEKELVEFLPQIKKEMNNEEFIATMNSGLLSKLQDPFTILQSNKNYNNSDNSELHSNSQFDYFKIEESQFSDIGNIMSIDSIISEKSSMKPLVIDLRINRNIELDIHTNTFFDYFISMFIEKPIPLCMNVSREHFGWDEYNDWWFYEQRWKVANKDKQIKGNGRLNPFTDYSEEIRKHAPEFNFDDFSTITRPVYLLTNNSFLSYYYSLLLALKTNRNNTYILNENSGKQYISDFSEFKSYDFENFNFILNTGFYINKGISELAYDLESSIIDEKQIVEFINSKPIDTNETNLFSFEILPKKYNVVNKDLSTEEKILGVIKVWTIIKHFYVHHELLEVNWENSLTEYLNLAQKTESNSEYYFLIQKMMAPLNDSHVSTFHPSILDFSKIFVAPIKFEWIEEKVIITGFDSSVNADIKIGDEILSIDGLLINKILENGKCKISSSNHQGLITTVINPGYFIGAKGSNMVLSIKKGRKQKSIELPRTTFVFQFMGFGDNRVSSNIYNDNIGYLNLALITNSTDLEAELIKMKNTDALIIDLRNSYPTADFERFLKLLSTERTKIRIDEVPIISAKKTGMKQTVVSEIINPDTSLTYKKSIAVLIDKTMISRPEDIAIALRAFPNITFIGEQTQGTDGERTKIYLPGGGETSFTGQLIKFGNGQDFQGIGIIPDIEVNRTIEGIIENEDEILNEALKFLRTP